MIRLSVVVEMDFPRSQAEVFAFLEDPQSMIEAGNFSRVSGKMGRRAKGTMVRVRPDGTEDVVRYKVKVFEPPHRTVIHHDTRPVELRKGFPRARIVVREENLYTLVEGGCHLTRRLEYEVSNAGTVTPNEVEKRTQNVTHAELAGLQKLHDALLRRTPSEPDRAPK